MDKKVIVKGLTAGLFVLSIALLLMSACGRPAAGSGNEVNSATPQLSPPTRVVTDDLGRQVTVPVKITRVVSLAPSLTESIFAVGAGDRLVGVTTFCNYPDGAKAIAKVGDTMTPNMESIVALKPDVVFVSTASQIETFMRTLEANGIAVYVSNPTTLGDLAINLRHLGELFDTSETADKVADDLARRVNDILEKCDTWSAIYMPATDTPAKKGKAIRVFTQISKEPLFTIGKTSFLNEVIAIAGGESVTANVETAYPKLSKETAAALNPDVIILSESDDNKEPNEVFKNSPAVKNGRVYKVNADLLSRPGPRLMDALEQIARDLHPDKFQTN